jgi:hypothetical protein
MLSDPRHSRLVLINMSRSEPKGLPADLIARWHENLILFPRAFETLGVGMHAIGEFDATQLPQALTRSVALLDGDGFSLWRNEQFTASLEASNVNVVFLGGAYLEEELFVAALEGVRRGYDIRLLADLSTPRCEAEGPLVLDRLSLQGVLTTTVRQALLECAVRSDDQGMTQSVLGLLS